METSNNFLHNLQVKLWQKTDEVTESLSAKEKKFTRDLIKGIIQSKSCILRQIAQSHKETISLEDTCKRYRRHLSKPEISTILAQNHLKQECGKVTKDNLIIFDPSDLRKEYAKKWKVSLRFMTVVQEQVVTDTTFWMRSMLISGMTDSE